MSKIYLAKFRNGSGSLGMNAIDFYRENGNLIKHEWAMGGETKKRVDTVPNQIDGYIKLRLNTEVLQ